MNSAEILFIFSPSFVLFPRCCMRRVHLYQRSHRCWCNSLWSDQRAFICPKKNSIHEPRKRKNGEKDQSYWASRSLQTCFLEFKYTTKINQLLKKYTDRYVIDVCIILKGWLAIAKLKPLLLFISLLLMLKKALDNGKMVK